MPTKENPDVLLAWNSSIDANKHNVRVLCDLAGLTYADKQIVCACVEIESNFQSHYLSGPNINEPVKHQNIVNGKVASTDWGIVQINDYWNIGPGKPFSSVQYVLANPQACVNFMIQMYKAGQIRLWSSYINLMAGKFPQIATKYGIKVGVTSPLK